MKNSAKDRIEMLKNAGVSVEDMLQFIIEEGATLEVGNKTKTMIIKGFDNIKIRSKEEGDLVAKVIQGGYIPTKQLYRRWVMAQMFRALTFNCKDFWGGGYNGYNKYVDNYLSWTYQIDFLIEEINRIVKIRKDGNIDPGLSWEYERIVTVPVIKVICNEVYKATYNHYIDKIKTNHYLEDRLTRFRFANEDIQHVWSWGNKVYEEFIPLLKEYRKRMLFMHEGTKKSSAFKDMYKAIGAYWTMKNMILFHGCKFKGMDGVQSIKYLDEKAKRYLSSDIYFRDYNGGGWRLFGLMMKLIEDNNFDFNARMRELYAN